MSGMSWLKDWPISERAGTCRRAQVRQLTPRPPPIEGLSQVDGRRVDVSDHGRQKVVERVAAVLDRYAANVAAHPPGCGASSPLNHSRHTILGRSPGRRPASGVSASVGATACPPVPTAVQDAQDGWSGAEGVGFEPMMGVTP